MRPVSAAFLRTIRSSHKMAVEAVVTDEFQTGTNPTGTVVPILDGDVRLDAGANIRSTLDMSTDGTAANLTPSGLITPYGTEVFVRRGIEYGNGSREWVSLGYHRIYSVEQNDAPNGPLRIQARDRMSGIVDFRMLSPRQFTPTDTVTEFYDSLVLEVFPSAVIEYDFDPDAVVINRTIVVEEDRYAALLDLTRALGKVMFWDHEGKLQVRTPPDPTVPVFDVSAGRDGVLVTLFRSLDREGVYNAVVARGEAPDGRPPVQAEARDMNPLSPTFWEGPFGKVPRYYYSPFITTKTQAVGAARSLLVKELGLPYNVDFSVVPNPALEPLDPVRIRYPGRAETHVIQTMTVPLAAGGVMDASTYEQTGTEVEVT